jgi:hypothetical protein
VEYCRFSRYLIIAVTGRRKCLQGLYAQILTYISNVTGVTNKVFSRIYPESFRDTSESDSPRMIGKYSVCHRYAKFGGYYGLMGRFTMIQAVKFLVSWQDHGEFGNIIYLNLYVPHLKLKDVPSCLPVG